MPWLPQEIEVEELLTLGWVTIELGEENIYFTDQVGHRFFCKQAELGHYKEGRRP